MLFFFFFQAEDGIRDGRVTGVQTCALPISDGHALAVRRTDRRPRPRAGGGSCSAEGCAQGACRIPWLASTLRPGAGGREATAETGALTDPAGLRPTLPVGRHRRGRGETRGTGVRHQGTPREPTCRQ